MIIDDYYAVVDLASTVLESKLTTLDIRKCTQIIWPSSEAQISALRNHYEATETPAIKIPMGRCPPESLDLFSCVYVLASGSSEFATPFLVSCALPGNERMPVLHIECWTIYSLEYRTRTKSKLCLWELA